MEKLNLICVDDQSEVLSAVSHDLDALSDWIVIEECESANEVLVLMDELDAAGEYIAVLISDHVMPDKTGVELLTEISADSRFSMTKKVLLTGQATHYDTISAINDAGIQNYVEKPWDGDKLIAMVRTLITEYIFDMGFEYSNFQPHLDPQVMFKRIR